MLSNTFFLRVPDRFYEFCRLRTLHISQPRMKAALEQKPHPKVEKLHLSRSFCTRLYGIWGRKCDGCIAPREGEKIRRQERVDLWDESEG